MGVSKVDFAGNTLVDLTRDSVTPETLLEGATAHNAAGDQIDGAVAVAPASTTTPKAPGTASAGSESAYARGDHVHPEPESIEADLVEIAELPQVSSTDEGKFLRVVDGVWSAATVLDANGESF